MGPRIGLCVRLAPAAANGGEGERSWRGDWGDSILVSAL